MKKIVFIILMLVSGYSYAVQPVEGMWFDPSASGRGATIEIQNGVMVITYFGYGDDQTDRWWQGVATETFKNSGVYTGELNAFQNGQCIGCPYSAPVQNVGSSIGQFTITFNRWTTAVLEWAGGTDNLIKFDWGYSGQKSYLFGSWMFTAYYSFGGSTGEDTINFYDTYESNGISYVLGNRSGNENTSDHLALATEAEISGVEYIFIVLDSSTSFYRAYLHQLNENKGSGRYWLYEKDESPTGDGQISISAKWLDDYELDISPQNKQLSLEKIYELKDRENYSIHLQDTKGMIDNDVLLVFESLQSEMNKLKAKQ